jgi:hypothetical protein
MFTTGSKLLIGATSVSLAATLVYAFTTSGNTGWTAGMGLLGATLALALLTGLNLFTRDGNVGAMDTSAHATSHAADRAPGNSMWPIVAAFGVGLVAIGLVTYEVIFQAGIVVLLAAAVEWMIHSWSERASVDQAFNDSLRARLLHPLEFPVLGAIVLAVIIYSFSRIMLYISKEAGPIVFGVLAFVVLIAGFLFASKASLSRSVTIGVSALALIGLAGTGVAMAFSGERDGLHVKEIVADNRGDCLSGDKTAIDKKASQTVGAKANVAATIILENGQLRAETIGIAGSQQQITLPRSNPSNILFRNLDEGKFRLTADLGTFDTGNEVNGEPVTEQLVTCTQLVERGGVQLLTLTMTKASPRDNVGSASQTPFTFYVPGVDQNRITIFVP